MHHSPSTYGTISRRRVHGTLTRHLGIKGILPEPGARHLSNWSLPSTLLPRAALVACLLIAGACSGGRTLGVPNFRGSPAFRTETILLDVQNRNYADVVVYGSRGGSWQRIGDVTGNASEMFEVPDQLTDAAASLRFRVHAIGSTTAADFVTEPIFVSGNAIVELRVASVLRMSSWSVR